MYIYLLINVCLRLRDISWVVCSCLPDGSHKQVIAWPHVSQKRIELINLGQFWFIRFAAGWHVAMMSLAYGSDLANRNGPVKSHQSTQFVGCLIQVWHRALAINYWMMNADFIKEPVFILLCISLNNKFMTFLNLQLAAAAGAVRWLMVLCVINATCVISYWLECAAFFVVLLFCYCSALYTGIVSFCIILSCHMVS